MNKSAYKPGDAGERQTARNNKLLAGVKRMMNAKIYARTVQLVNAPTGESEGWRTYGQLSAVAYLQQFFSMPISAEVFESYPAGEPFKTFCRTAMHIASERYHEAAKEPKQ
jgi:hypothetical protein